MTTDLRIHWIIAQCGATVARGGRCKRVGYDTYTKRWGARCWQHDPFRDVDEGEEAYKEHQA